MTAARTRAGRPPAGARGEMVSTYHQLTIRLPDETVGLLRAIGGIFHEPMWRVVERSVNAFVEQLPPAERRLVLGTRALQQKERQ